MDRPLDAEHKLYPQEIVGIRHELAEKETFWRHQSARISTALPAIDFDTVMNETQRCQTS